MAASSSSPATKASAALHAALTPANLDAFLLHLNKCLQTPAGIDAVLATVCYSARLTAVVLGTAAGRALLHEPARQLATLVLALPSRGLLLLGPASASTPLVPTGRSSAKAAAAASALVLAGRLRALGSLMTEARMMLRLWGLLSMYVWARRLVMQLLARRRAAAATRAAARTETAAQAEAKEEEAEQIAAVAPTSTAEVVIGWAQLASCTLYQVFENAGYLSARGVLGLTKPQQAAATRWSSRFFAVFVLVELGRTAVEIAHKDTDTAAKQAEAVELHKNLVRYASLAPVMAHWGMEKGFLGDVSLTLLGCVPAALQIHKAWKETK